MWKTISFAVYPNHIYNANQGIIFNDSVGVNYVSLNSATSSTAKPANLDTFSGDIPFLIIAFASSILF